MSQHYFNAVHRGDPITVLLGWDPLDHFFMIVERREPAPGQDDYLFISTGAPTLDDLRVTLKTLCIPVPRVMFEQVEHDRRNGLGSRVVVYAADGSFPH